MRETLNIDKVGAAALLASTQQLRTHWSGVMTRHLTIAFTMNAALWAYFLKGYFESPKHPEPYLLVISGLSSILFGFWRLNARHIDDFVASLYPDLLLYEGKLGAPSSRGTCSYLSKELPPLRPILQSDEFSPEEKAYLISDLVKEKKMGQRGYKVLDFLLLAFS